VAEKAVQAADKGKLNNELGIKTHH
jgi:hypothetical protein